ncbi:hypothetical protein F2Q68_00039230 [Brassica cretica]|uniref:Uncharacterized protein n=1 Tax=Brassica cretica TaxID=69181 RepID=A0A8S9MMN7_BRACR|nr:hypothetical protein F2Q68_00039230 [Brassica cretica]
MVCFQNIRLINLRHLLTMVEPLIRLIVHSRSLLALRTLRFILGNLEVHSNLCSDTGGSVDILYKNPEYRTLSSEGGPLSMSTGCGPMSRLRWLPFTDPFRMSSSPYRAASVKIMGNIVLKPRVS